MMCCGVLVVKISKKKQASLRNGLTGYSHIMTARKNTVPSRKGLYGPFLFLFYGTEEIVNVTIVR